VPIGVTWSATGGGIDPGGVYTAGSTAGTFHVVAKAASANVADTTIITVTPPAQLPVVYSGDAPEPGPNDVLLAQDNFDSYKGILATDPVPNAAGGGWQNPQWGTVQLITGRGGAGKAVRFAYATTSQSPELGRDIPTTTDLYVRYYYRLSPGADPTFANQNQSGFKWFMAWRDRSLPRYTFAVTDLPGGPSGFANSGLEFGAHDNSSSRMPNPFQQNINKSLKFGTTRDYQWHKYTLHIVTGSGGYEQIWVDGVKVLDSSAFGYDHNAGGIQSISFPGNFATNMPDDKWDFTVDVDDFVMWHH